MSQPDLQIRWQTMQGIFFKPSFWFFVGLMLINWTLETFKWMILAGRLERIDFLKAFQSVLAGCSITMITPNRTGEFGGRMLFLKSENRIQAISATVLGSISQLSVTALFGCIGMLYFQMQHQITMKYGSWLMIAGLMLFAATLFLFFFSGKMVKMLSRLRFLNKLTVHLRVVNEFSNNDLLRIYFLSVLRYSVFILQFIVVFQLMDIGIGEIDVIWMTSLFFILMAMLPTIGFTELPVKLFTASSLYGMMSSNIIGIEFAIFLVWLINLFLPSVAGSLMLLNVKIIQKR